MANVKISDLTQAAAALGTQELEVNDSLTSKKITVTQLNSFISAAILAATNTWSGAQSFNSGNLKLNGSSSGAATLNAPAAASTYVVTLPAATSTLACLGLAQTFTASQRGTLTTDNDGSFDLNVTNNFVCTPTATFALTFTNITSGQSGFILLVNTGGYAVTAAATTKVGASTLSTISAAGTYLLSYLSNGTNVYVTASGALS